MRLHPLSAIGGALLLVGGLVACDKAEPEGKKVDKAAASKKGDGDKKAEPAAADKKAEPAAGDKKAEPAAGDKKAEPAAADKKVEPAAGDKKAEDKVVAAVKDAAMNVKGVKELADKGKDIKAALSGKKEVYTPEAYEKRILSLAKCEIKGRYIDSKCPEQVAFREERRKFSSPKGAATIAAKHLNHESPAVRMQAASMMGSFFGASADSQAKVLAAFEAEKNEAVARQLVNVVGSKASKPEIAGLLRKAIVHPSPLVRREAVSWLSTSFATKMDDSVALALKVIETDKDPETRQYACERIGGRGDASALPVYKKFTTDAVAEKDPKMFNACLKGLLAMWVNYPFFRHADEKAFDLYVNVLVPKKCTKDVPSWSGMSSIGRYAADPKQAKAAPWMEAKKPKLIEALGKVVTCKEANWMARTGAVKSLVELKADKAVFAKLLDAYKGDEKAHPHTTKALAAQAK